LSEFREFQDGEVIAGTRYRVLSLIGVGGMGSVYEVEHIELGKRFVLKALLRELSRRDDLVQRLRNEWRALARLQHPNIVNVTDAGTSGSGVPFYVMERLDGDTLAAVLRKKRRIHVLDALHIAASVLEALSAAHEIGIIHRDVKPANVLVVSGGGVKLLDFGIAKISDANGVVTARGLAVGTPRYMSPEQARGERVDGRSDIYASALILYEMIAGVGPFDDVQEANELLLAHLAREAPPLSSLVSGVSPELERILSRMLAKDCRQRPEHAREAAEQLRQLALRQRSIPSTDAPTAEAGYAAETVAQRPPKPIHEALTRPEGAARARPAAQANLSDDSLTQRMALSPQTTQVTVSASTGSSAAPSSQGNTTFVSAPSFDVTTTLQMSTVPTSATATRSPIPAPSQPPFERPERTEMLGEFPALPPMQIEPPDTRTQVPVPERPRPISITPPPVVDTARALDPRPRPRIGRWVGIVAAALGVLAASALILRRAAVPSQNMVAAAPAAPAGATEPSTASRALEEGAPAALEPAAGGAPAGAPFAQATPSTQPPLAAPLAPRVGPPAASASVRNSRVILDAKRLKTANLARPSGAAPPVPTVRNLSHPSGPKLPDSGL